MKFRFDGTNSIAPAEALNKEAPINKRRRSAFSAPPRF